MLVGGSTRGVHYHPLLMRLQMLQYLPRLLWLLTYLPLRLRLQWELFRPCLLWWTDVDSP